MFTRLHDPEKTIGRSKSVHMVFMGEWITDRDSLPHFLVVFCALVNIKLENEYHQPGTVLLLKGALLI